MVEGFESEKLHEGLFSCPHNRLIFRKIRELRAGSRPVDFVILNDSLSSEVPAVEISTLGDGVIKGSFGEAYFRDYVDQLLRIEKERRVKARIDDAIRRPDFLPDLKRILADYEPDAQDTGAASIAALIPGFRSYIETRRGSKLWGHDLKSLPDLARILNGIREIIVLAAKAKTGKSTLALQIASDLHGQGIPVVYFDFENGPYNLLARELCRREQISLGDIFSSEIHGVGYTENGIRSLAEYQNFSIIMDRRLSVERVQAYIKKAKSAAGRSSIFMVIDSLQKLPMENLKERRAAVDLWLRGFEALKAEDPDLSILLVSELSREGGKPKESGDIEYTGHFLLELQTNRTEEELAERGDDGIRKLFIKSARDIPIPAGPLKLEADFRYWRFTEMEGPA